MDFKKEHQKLIRKAEKMPGVADLLVLYKQYEKSFIRNQEYLQHGQYSIFFSNTNVSNQQP